MGKRDELTSLMNELNSHLVFGEQKYFHARTVENLIYHFDDIKSERDKQWIFDTLKGYFDNSMQIATSINREISKKLYYSYVEKLANYYRHNLGFVILINRNVVYFVYVLLLTLCYFLSNIYITLGLFFLFVINMFRVFLKYRQHKVYAIYW